MRPAWMDEIWRFAVCGLGAAAADIGAYSALTHFAGLHPLAANLISRPLGGLVSFTANRFWTFRHRPMEKSLPVQFGRYWIVWIAAYGLSELFLFLWLRVLPGDQTIAKLLAEGCVGILSFLAQRLWTYR
ncbi:MAG: GtrA family protein [Verrucomicrobia bacterium]|nr:GtrA family protein [Verrucomicrobiota bacterium]